MTLDTLLFNKIETPEFESELVIAGGPVLFSMILDNHPDVQELVNVLREIPESQRELQKHLYVLLAEEPEPGFVHPNDLFIAAYLWVLNKVNEELAFDASKRVLQASQLRWARIIAKSIHAKLAVQGTSGEQILAAVQMFTFEGGEDTSLRTREILEDEHGAYLEGRLNTDAE
ncbi:MAG: hypothetical protein L0154_03375 [Chloroflexi bacterium]|nr:hypothetical protein [Chloroflexota bacterium]